MKIYKVRCPDCDITFLADANRHNMDNCPNYPKCRNGIDLEESYHRIIGNIEILEVFDPPHFEDEDDYHSALLSWMNSIDMGEYELKKENNLLLILKR